MIWAGRRLGKGVGGVEGLPGPVLGGVGVCWRRVFWIIAERWSGVLSWDPVGVEGVLGGLVLPCGVGHVGALALGYEGHDGCHWLTGGVSIRVWVGFLEKCGCRG